MDNEPRSSYCIVVEFIDGKLGEQVYCGGFFKLTNPPYFTYADGKQYTTFSECLYGLMPLYKRLVEDYHNMAYVNITEVMYRTHVDPMYAVDSDVPLSMVL